jgi:hypothetical protein
LARVTELFGPTLQRDEELHGHQQATSKDRPS